MEKITENYDFLYKLLKVSPKEAEKLIIEASPEQKASLLACLSFRKDLKDIPLKPREKRIISFGLRSKKLNKFFKTYRKFVLAVIMCTLSRIVSEAILFVCDA